jgi:hypothetical protein
MPRKTVFEVEVLGVVPVQIVEAAGKAQPCVWLTHDVEVVCHEAVGPEFQVMPSRVFLEQVQKAFEVLIVKKDLGLSVAPLRQVVGESGKDNSW